MTSIDTNPLHQYDTTEIGPGGKTSSPLVDIAGNTVMGVLLRPGIVSTSLSFSGRGTPTSAVEALRNDSGGLIAIVRVDGIVLLDPREFRAITSIQMFFNLTETAPTTEITWISRPN